MRCRYVSQSGLPLTSRGKWKFTTIETISMSIPGKKVNWFVYKGGLFYEKEQVFCFCPENQEKKISPFSKHLWDPKGSSAKPTTIFKKIFVPRDKTLVVMRTLCFPSRYRSNTFIRWSTGNSDESRATEWPSLDMTSYSHFAERLV